eukprot:357195-Amphidinium_carterae.2
MFVLDFARRPVYVAIEWRNWMRENLAWIKLAFVSAGYTSVCQPDFAKDIINTYTSGGGHSKSSMALCTTDPGYQDGFTVLSRTSQSMTAFVHSSTCVPMQIAFSMHRWPTRKHYSGMVAINLEDADTETDVTFLSSSNQTFLSMKRKSHPQSHIQRHMNLHQHQHLQPQ